MIKPAYSVSFLLSINIFVWQNVLYFLDALVKHNNHKRQISVPGGIPNLNPSKGAAVDSHLRQLGHWNGHVFLTQYKNN